MKRWMSIAATALLIVGAGLALTAEALVTPENNPEVMFRKNGCFECHSVDKKVVGPSFRDIAAKYQNDGRARAALVEKVKKGGKGNWNKVTGGVPMPPHSPRISDADIRRLVDWVLSLKEEN